MKKNYHPKDIEEITYNLWKKNNYFKPNNQVNKESFCIILPPPNITGSLHMGHAFQHTIMDILIRYHRMQGHNTLWQTGMDHAGIATQIIVSKKIKLEKNITLNQLGREKFIKKCWEWKKISQNNINYQMKRLGNSIDWSREKFTLDPDVAKGVQKVFIDLYNNNLIYRKKKLSNWDTELKTVISDLELEYRTKKGNVWNIKYPILYNKKQSNKKKYIIVSTTRPETLLGDTAIAVNPLDKRYNSLIGKYVIVPLVNRIIPIISDQYADINKGTGCVKITPAHDFNDYEVALRHKLPLINIFTYNGNISHFSNVYDIHGNISNIYDSFIPLELQGLNRFLARKKIINILEKLNLIDNILNENITVTYGDRSGSIIEPMLTDQWYLHISPLAKKAILFVSKDYIKFIPKQYKNMYLSWMNNIQDWCISRQLWWGHRIPAWYDINGNIYVGKNEKDIRKKYSISYDIKIIQDEDVLDTWFSSSLWTFISLDWPKKDNLLHVFHPTNVIVSGFDIIFFWIARMIMMTIYVMKDYNIISKIPFKYVYITGLICDELGKKMSKSKGNVIDPLDIIDGISLSDLLKKCTENITNDKKKNNIYNNIKKKFPNGIENFGSDALRFTFSALSSKTRRISWDMNRVKGYKNFCNKIWNIARFIKMNYTNQDIYVKKNKKCLLFFNSWILIQLNNTIYNYRNALDSYRFDIASNKLYNFIWHTFCDWYIEIVKIIFQIGSILEIQNTKYTLIYVFESLLRLAHPIIPFITEVIWKKIKNIIGIVGETIMLQIFPTYDVNILDNHISCTMVIIQKIIMFLRNVRISLNVHYKTLVSLFLRNVDIELKSILLSYKKIIKKIGFLKNITILSDHDNDIPNAIIGKVDNIKIFILIIKRINYKLELEKIKKQMNIVNNKINILKNLISNKNFIIKAPNKIVLQKKNDLKKMTLLYSQLMIQKNDILKK